MSEREKEIRDLLKEAAAESDPHHRDVCEAQAYRIALEAYVEGDSDAWELAHIALGRDKW